MVLMVSPHCHPLFSLQEGKDKSFLLEKLRSLQKFNTKPKQKNQKKVCFEHFTHKPKFRLRFVIHFISPCSLSVFSPILQNASWHSKDLQSSTNTTVQAFLNPRRFEEEEDEEIYSTGPLPVPSDTSASSAVVQAMLARQAAEYLDDDPYQMSDEDVTSSSALAQAMQARQEAEVRERDYYSPAGFPENSTNTPSTFTQSMQARWRAEEYEADDPDDPSASASAVMMQVMQARQRAEEQLQNPAPAGSSALIQAMLARQQAQNEYDDGYWTSSHSGETGFVKMT